MVMEGRGLAVRFVSGVDGADGGGAALPGLGVEFVGV